MRHIHVPKVLLHKVGDGPTLPKIIQDPEAMLAQEAWVSVSTHFREALIDWLNIDASPSSAA